MRPVEIWNQVADAIAAGLDRFEDAIPTGWREALTERWPPAEDHRLVLLDASQVFFADTEIRGRDAFELKRAAALQLHTHAPTDVESLIWCVLPGRSDTETTQIAFADRTTLQRLDEAEPCAGFAVAGEHSSGVLRTSAQDARRNANRVTAVLISIAVIAGALITVAGFADYQARKLNAREAARDTTLMAANTARDNLNTANERLAALPTGPALGETVTAVDELAARRPEGWYGLSVLVENGELTAVFDLGEEAAPVDAFRSAGTGDRAEWTLTPEPAENRIRVSRTFPDGEEPR